MIINPSATSRTSVSGPYEFHIELAGFPESEGSTMILQYQAALSIHISSRTLQGRDRESETERAKSNERETKREREREREIERERERDRVRETEVWARSRIKMNISEH